MGVNLDAQSRIAKAVLGAGRTDVGELFYSLGMNGSTGGELVTSMVKRGLLKRSGDTVSIGDRALLQKCVDIMSETAPTEDNAAAPAAAKVNGSRHVPAVPVQPAKKDTPPCDDKPKASSIPPDGSATGQPPALDEVAKGIAKTIAADPAPEVDQIIVARFDGYVVMREEDVRSMLRYFADIATRASAAHTALMRELA